MGSRPHKHVYALRLLRIKIKDMVWYGMVLCGTVWYIVWFGMLWYGIVWYGKVWCGIMVWYGMAWFGMAW